MQVILGEDGSRARREMQEGLLHIFFALTLLSSVGLFVRELLMGGPLLAATLSSLVSLGVFLWSRRTTAFMRWLGAGLCIFLVLSIGQAAHSLGGAAGSALSFSFVPGLLAMLVLSTRWGLFVTMLMLAVQAVLWVIEPPSDIFDQLRFQDEVLMTVFAAGLGYALTCALRAYEKSVELRKHALLRAAERRKSLTSAIYEELEPLAEQLVQEVESAGRVEDFERVRKTGERLGQSLEASRRLAAPEGITTDVRVDRDATIRVRTMRIWLRIGAAFIFVVMMRNFLVGYAFAPSLFSFSCCLIIDLLLGKLAKPRHLEWIALFIGVFAMLPLIGHILEYGPTPNAPALVVTPSVVLFTALLSQGPATWAVVLLQMVLLGWVGWDKELSLLQARLLGNLLLDFLIVAVAVRGIFGLRRRFAATLRQQESDLLEVGRRQRRLSGMLFHDTRNYLQALTLQAECADDPEMRDHARSLSHRIARLVRLSKQFLMDKSADAPLELTSVDLNDVVESLVEAYGPRMESKGLRLTADVSEASRVMADRDLLVESVMGNLLSNAIKFSPSGGAIELSAKSEGSFVCIHLRDEGPGVPPEVVDLLGQEGPVPSHVGTAGEEGQGYGLQLVREHTAKMGGRLALEARAPRGTDAAIWLAAA